VFLFGFFRDPERTPPEGDNALLSPADGRVADIEEVRETEFLAADAVRIGVFMSLFDVHVNRAPLAGRVVFRDYRPGKFHNALGARASRENECSLVGIERADGTRVLVRQIAGVIARRIVCDCEVGTELARGQRLGMVKFGSRLEVFVPKSSGFRPAVAVGDRVRAGRSVLGHFASEPLP
jgi:phosphatidylserine decarboxylase